MYTIIEATERWATSKNKQRAHLRSVITIKESSKKSHQKKEWQIKFSALDVNILEDGRNDPIVISIVICTYLVERIWIDDRSAVEVLIYKAFKGMGLDESLFRPTRLIYGFAN